MAASSRCPSLQFIHCIQLPFQKGAAIHKSCFKGWGSGPIVGVAMCPALSAYVTVSLTSLHGLQTIYGLSSHWSLSFETCLQPPPYATSLWPWPF